MTNYYNLDKNTMEIVEYPKNTNSVMEFTYIENVGVIEETNFINDINQVSNANPGLIPQYLSYVVNNSTQGPFDYPDEKVKVVYSMFEFNNC